MENKRERERYKFQLSPPLPETQSTKKSPQFVNQSKTIPFSFLLISKNQKVVSIVIWQIPNFIIITTSKSNKKIKEKKMKEAIRERNTAIVSLVQSLNQTLKQSSYYYYFWLLLYFHFQQHKKQQSLLLIFIINCSFILSSNQNPTLTSKSQHSPKTKTSSPPLILLLERDISPNNSSFSERKLGALSMNQFVKFYFLGFG